MIGTCFDQFKSAILAVSLPSCTPTAYLLGRQNGGGEKRSKQKQQHKTTAQQQADSSTKAGGGAGMVLVTNPKHSTI